ncbi:MAG: BCCT family transporter, partial [Dysgonamonadaceae bacterium]|nr:BCCT family transporter [Dysgonamonadaceae bacterium]MDD3356442.1 BCCT family transporter [Dysgonamonadaceae bacterium]MDD3727780.1 BCCT family transporter [Dysgonamonadaceae bacterium]MDD4246691.1 BCCT family transporter [Dysgonamonadaceae bacterium]MDD4606195.1 BCCT family transporter [Dysgonamonadaceae bacterium]
MNFKKEKEKLYSRNFTKLGMDMNLFVSVITALLVLAFSIFTILKPNISSEFFASVNVAINKNFNWLYVLTMNASLAFILFIGFSKFGNIRLGGYTAKPEFGNVAWFAMMFSAGVGIGIFFYGVAEPIYHLNIPTALQSGSAFDNFKVMYLDWGVHAWAVYGLLAIGLGYFSYNKGLPFAIRSLFYPLLKEKIYGIWGDIVDTVATLSVLFGLAISLGLGAKQINSGLNYVFGIPDASNVQAILIIVITIIATFSVVSGVSRGIKWLSEANLVISTILLLGITLIGPAGYILSTYLSGMGIYLRDVINLGLFTAIEPDDVAWQGTWTIFYWAWWISWAPFVGTFIARISKGRTIRQIALGVISLPTIAITLAMTVLGASGIYLNNLHGGVITQAIESNVATSLFEMFKYLTSSVFLQMLLSIVAVIAIIIFFITSSDSGSLVVSSLTSSGRSTPPKVQRVFWAFMEGTIALSVLLIGGEAALTTIQSAIVILGLPFSIILLMIIFSLAKELQESYRKYSRNRNITLKKQLGKIEKDAKFE